MSRRKIILVVCTLFICTMSWGQLPTGLQRSVAYKTSTCKTFKIPCYAELEALSQLDWVYLNAKPATMRISEFVIVNNWLTISYNYPQMPRYERDYEFEMGKSVTDKWGTRLYYHDGEQYYNLENEVANEDFAVDAAEIGTYGIFNDLFDVSIDVICVQLDEAGIPYYRWGQKLLMTHEEEVENPDDEDEIIVKRMEIETDFGTLYMEMRTFVNGEHQMTDRKEYQRVNDFIVPTMGKRVYYSTLPSETKYQITETETYLSYKVTGETGNVIVNVEEVENSTDFTIDISLDEEQSTAFVNFTPPITGDVNAKIINGTIVVLEQNATLTEGEILQIGISDLEPGTYTVVCTQNDNVAQADFVKNGISTYQEPDPAEMTITVAPNPATSSINVIFPVDIANFMHVKITDMMGISYWESDVSIAGNILTLDVIFLPAGNLYYIICTNNDGTGTAKFFKR